MNIFSQGFVFNPYWFNMFFDPMIQTPMQWFSFTNISIVTIVCIFLLSIKLKNKILLIFQFSFWSIVLLFIFKYYSQLGYDHSRYLYYIYPFYIIIFSSSIYVLFSLVIRNKFAFINYSILFIFLIFNIFIPQNTIHGAVHDLSIWGDENNDRQPTSSGSRNSFLNVIDTLKLNGFSNKDTIVIQGEGSFYITWYFDFPITRTYTVSIGASSTDSYKYETGDKVYIVDTANGVDELNAAINKYDYGFLLWHSSQHPENDFKYNNVNFKYIIKSEGYKLYKWSKI